LGDRLFYEANLILLSPTLVTMAMTFVEFGQKLIEVVGVVVVVLVVIVIVVVVVFKLLYLAEICTLMSML